MGVYIKGMEMPNKKNGAVLIIYPDGKCAFEDGKTYQAVPVPAHGRLIDADALEETYPLLCDCSITEDGFVKWGEWGYSLEQIRNAPTTIPASEEVEA